MTCFNSVIENIMSVSYTHLDVYKRQSCLSYAQTLLRGLLATFSVVDVALLLPVSFFRTERHPALPHFTKGNKSGNVPYITMAYQVLVFKEESSVISTKASTLHYILNYRIEACHYITPWFLRF